MTGVQTCALPIFVGAVENRGVENGGNDRTEGFYRVKRSGLAKVSNLY